MKKIALFALLTVASACGRDDNQGQKSADTQSGPATPRTSATHNSEPTPVPGPGSTPVAPQATPVQPVTQQTTPAPVATTPKVAATPPPLQPGQPQGSFGGMINLDTIGNCVVAKQVGIQGLACRLGVNSVTGAPEVAISVAVLQLTNAPICTFQSVGQNASRFTVTALSPTNVSISPVKDGVSPGVDPCYDPCGYCPVNPNPPQSPFVGDVALFVCEISG